jgi:Ca2+-binding RTX toxin-like protein
LDLGVAESETLATNDDFDLYKVVGVSPGDHLVVQMHAGNSYPENELYVRRGALPTSTQFDAAATTAGHPSQFLDVVGTQAGTYYVMVYTNFVGPLGGDYTIQADTDDTLTELIPCMDHNDSLATNKDFDLYQVRVDAGENLIVQMYADNSYPENELYIRRGALPTWTVYDAVSKLPVGPSQYLDIMDAQAGTYYVMAYTNFVGPLGDNYTIDVDIPNPVMIVPHDPPGPVTVIARRNGANLEVVVQGTGQQLLNCPANTLSSMTIVGADAQSDTCIVDMAYGGTFTLPNGIHFVGGTGGPDQLDVIHPDGDTDYSLDNTTLSMPELNVTHHGVERFDITDAGGDDTYEFATQKKRIALHDGDGVDTLDFSGARKRVILKLVHSDGRYQWIHAGNNWMALDGIIENAIGTPFADKIIGNDANNTITAGAGNDTVYGRPGADVIDTGEGDDIVAGNRHADTLLAGPGEDSLNGGGGGDALDGGDGADVLYAFKGSDVIRGGAGMDELIGGDGNDILLGGPDDDVLFGAVGRDILIGGNGRDTLNGAAGEDVLTGGTTAHDSNDVALLAILAEWQSGRLIDDRIAYLVNGGGFNGSYTLDGSVIDDGDSDTLEGGYSPDWFIKFSTDVFAPGEPEPTDRVTNR